MSAQTMSNQDALAKHIQLEGVTAIDVGSGAGGLVRFMRLHGANSTGVECGKIMQKLALEADPDNPQAYVDGVGQDLPFDDGSIDLVVFSASLHHIPADEMLNTLTEAHRVLRNGGTLYVVEPKPEGPSFEACLLIDDETVVRDLAQQALLDAPQIGFELQTHVEYRCEASYPDADAWLNNMIGIDPDRTAKVERNRAASIARFHDFGTKRGNSVVFVQPMTLKIFRKT